MLGLFLVSVTLTRAVLNSGLSLNGSELVVYSDDFNNANPVATFIKQTGGSRLLK